jgi:hypothetical protein
MNGWSNYPTWRVYLEFFNDTDVKELTGCARPKIQELVAYLKEQVESTIDEQSEATALNYANAFIADVDWQEIAEHMLDDGDDS